MKFIILGSTGMLGQTLVTYLINLGHDVVGISRSNSDYNIDIQDHDKLFQCFDFESPDIIINTVAIVNIEFCENNPDKAYLINARPVDLINKYCSEKNIKFIQISTDQYFSGDNKQKHDENSPVVLLNEYSRTKYLAEQFTLLNENSLVIRTNIVGFRNSSKETFAEWTINSLENQIPINVFDDYFTSSIDTFNFSKILFDLIKKDASGLINISSNEVFSKKDFIFMMAEIFNFSTNNCNTVSSTLKYRGDSLGLDCSKCENIVGYEFPTLREVVLSLKNNY